MKLGEDYLDAGKWSLERCKNSAWLHKKGNYVELHYGDPLPGYSLHVKEGQTLKKHG